MSIDNLKSSIPDYAKDLKLNLGSMSRSTALTEEQLWGTMLTCAATSKSKVVLREISEEAKDYLSAEAYNAALGAASIMGMNNVFYRTKHFLDGAYDDLRAGLRMNIIGSPGVDKTNFELWCLAASAMNGCSVCVSSHEEIVRNAKIEREAVLEAIRIASIVAGVAVAMESADF